MNRLRLFLPTALLLILSSRTTSPAQEGGRQRQGSPLGGGVALTIDKPALLSSVKVREELKINQDQAKKIDEILAAHREASSALSPTRLRDVSPEEREKKRKETAEKSAELRKKTESKLDRALENEQLKRLNEIELQQHGVDGLVSDRVASALKLTKEQEGKIRGAIATRDEELRKLAAGQRSRGGSGGGLQEIREKREKLRKEAEEKGLSVLSKEQREELDKLKGKPFELDRRSLFRDRDNRSGGESKGRRDGGGERRPENKRQV